MLSPRLLVIHDAGGSGEDDIAELTRWQELDDPLLEVFQLDVVAGADDAGLVDAVSNVSELHARPEEGVEYVGLTGR